MPEQIILLVEDNPDDVKLTLKAMKQSHVKNEVVVAKDGQEALDWLFCAGTYANRDPCAIPAVVLLDINLPKVNGLEVLERIRQGARTELLPVIMLTSSKEDADVLKSYKLHANSYIQKPVDFARFAEAIREVSVYWLVINVSPIGRPRQCDESCRYAQLANEPPHEEETDGKRAA
ncbi:MAG: response regulator [Armatimonadota bacterium]